MQHERRGTVVCLCVVGRLVGREGRRCGGMRAPPDGRVRASRSTRHGFTLMIAPVDGTRLSVVFEEDLNLSKGSGVSLVHVKKKGKYVCTVG